MSKENVKQYMRAGLSSTTSACALADEWLVSHCPVDMGNPFAFDGIEDRNMRLKALSEITLLSAFIGSDSNSSVATLAGRWLEDSSLRCKALSSIRHSPQRAHLILPFLNAQVRANRLSTAEIHDVQILFELFETRLLNELVPYRSIDFWYLCWKLSGRQAHLDRFMSMGFAGCLAENTSAWNIDDRRAYAITHTIFYLTDFGALEWPDGLCSIDFLEGLLDSLSLRAEIEGNCDLLAEYLLCRRCLDLQSRRLVQEIEILLAAQHKTGLWPAPVEENTLNRHVNPEKFFEHYHTTLMARVALSGLSPMAADRTFEATTPAPLFERLVVPIEFFQTPGFAEIYRAYRTMIAYGECSRDSSELEIDKDLLIAGIAHPRTCVHVITYIYWASRSSRSDRELRGLLLPILEVAHDSVLGNRGLFRIWALVFSLCPEERDAAVARRLFKRLLPTERNSAWWSIGAQDRLDTLVGLLILKGELGEALQDGVLGESITDELRYAMCSGSVGALVTLLPFIGSVEMNEGVLSEAAEYFASMLPESQCFGWLGDGRYGESRTVAEDMQLQAAQVFLCKRIRQQLKKKSV